MNGLGYVSAGSPLVFEASVPEQMREDILLSTLYLQLTSNKKYPEFKDFSAWNIRYAEAMRYLHYNVAGRVRITFSSSSPSKTVKLETIIREGLAPLLLPDEHGYLEVLLQQLSDLQRESKGMKLLGRHAVEVAEDTLNGETVHRVRVHAGVVDNTATVKMVTINFATQEPVQANFFTQHFMLSNIIGGVEMEYFSAQLDEDYAELKRQTVLKALEGRYPEEVERLF